MIKTISPIGHWLSSDLRLRFIRMALPATVKIVMAILSMNMIIAWTLGFLFNHWRGLQHWHWHLQSTHAWLVLSGDRMTVAMTVNIKLKMRMVKRCLSVRRFTPKTAAMSTTAANCENISKPKMKNMPVTKRTWSFKFRQMIWRYRSWVPMGHKNIFPRM